MLLALLSRPCRAQARSDASRGAFFLASSAGGVYAGVGASPYDEFSPTKPLAAYGWAKLRAEQTVTDWARGARPS